MKKQFHKIKIAAENLSSRSGRSDYKDDEVYQIEKTVDKYKEVFEKLLKKFPPYNSSDQDKEKRDKRIKKAPQYKLAEALEESSRELPPNSELFTLLKKCGEMEKALACLAVDTEIENETKIGNKVKVILENDITEIAATKRNFSRYLTEYKSIKKSVESAAKSGEHPSKLTQLQMDMEQTETKVEKERDCWAAQMFDLIAKDEIIVECVSNYLISQKDYHERALRSMEDNLNYVNSLISSSRLKRKFGVSLSDHLISARCEIAYPIELAVCYLIENGLEEEGLLRVGCASTKLKRMKYALDARQLQAPLPLEYQDVNVFASILKQYLRELPEPLLTNKLYKEFISAAQTPVEEERKVQLKKVLAKLPKENYVNLRYLMKFLCLVVENSDKNKMNSHNVSIVMSPNLLWPPKNQNSEDYSMQMNSSNAVNTIVDDCITHYGFMFDNFDVEFFLTLQRENLKAKKQHKRNNSNDNNFASGTIRSLPSDDSLNTAGIDDKSTNSPKMFRKKPNKSVAPSPPSKLPNSNFSRPHPQQQLQYQQMALNQQQQQQSTQAQNYQFDSQNFLAQETANNVDPKPPPISASDDEKIKQIENELQQYTNSNNTSMREESTTPTTITTTPVPAPRPMPVPSPRAVLTPIQKSDGETQTPTTTIKPNLPEKPVIPKRPNLNNLLYTENPTRNSLSGSSPTNVFRYSREFKEIPFIDTPTDSDQENHTGDGISVENATPATPTCKPRTPTSATGTLKRPQVPAPPPPSSITPTSTNSTAAVLHSSD